MRRFQTKNLAALSGVLSLALIGSVASAATVADFSVDIAGNVNGLSSNTISGSATAILDDSGILTINARTTTVTTFFGLPWSNFTTDSVNVITGNWNSVDTLSSNSGTSTATACTNNGGAITNGCNNVTLNSPVSFTSVTDPITFDLSVGGTTTIKTSLQQGRGFSASTYNETYTLTRLAAVPLPAAAWLFGSALIGLVLVPRNRRHADTSC